MSPRQAWTLCPDASCGTPSWALFRTDELSSSPRTGILAWIVLEQWVHCLHEYLRPVPAAWRNVKPCALDWPSWWTDHSSVWELSSTSNTSESFGSVLWFLPRNSIKEQITILHHSSPFLLQVWGRIHGDDEDQGSSAQLRPRLESCWSVHGEHLSWLHPEREALQHPAVQDLLLFAG